MNTSNEKEQGRGAGQLLLLMAAFGLPMVGAWFLYFNPDLLPGGRSNRGELVQPVHPISDQVFSTRDGATFSSAELKGYWTLMLSAGESCAEPCRKRIYDMRQIRKAMAENYGEIKRVVLFTTPSPSMETDADLTFSGFMKAFAEGAVCASRGRLSGTPLSGGSNGESDDALSSPAACG
jgi:hypothetical protein